MLWEVLCCGVCLTAERPLRIISVVPGLFGLPNAWARQLPAYQRLRPASPGSLAFGLIVADPGFRNPHTPGDPL